MERLDLAGKQVGKWTVVCPDHTGHRGVYWLCRCKCGNEKIAIATELNRGSHTGCSNCSPINVIHGMRYTPEYGVWVRMKQRCNNPNNQDYHFYGGRGISVCDRWKESFENFFEDMGKRPSKGHSIDRVDNDGDYTPQNCRWATQFEQKNNTRRNTFITFNDKTRTISEWADKTGISYDAILYRISEKWPVDRMLTTPTRKMQFHMITFNEKTQTIKEWSRALGIGYTTLYARIVHRGWSIDRAFTEKPQHR